MGDGEAKKIHKPVARSQQKNCEIWNRMMDRSTAAEIRGTKCSKDFPVQRVKRKFSIFDFLEKGKKMFERKIRRWRVRVRRSRGVVDSWVEIYCNYMEEKSLKHLLIATHSLHKTGGIEVGLMLNSEINPLDDDVTRKKRANFEK